jgi:5-methylcytosine-specific restriction endonuclease McrA
MPTRPQRYGRSPGPRPRYREFRPSASRRGYDRDWEALAKAKLDADPWCAHCRRDGRDTPASEVDHIKPFKDKADPLRLDWDNLQSLCKPCHSRKTTQDKLQGTTRRKGSGSTAGLPLVRRCGETMLVDQRSVVDGRPGPPPGGTPLAQGAE